MSDSRETPNAIKVFFTALLAGGAGLVGTYQLVFKLAERFAPHLDPTLLAIIALVGAVSVGMASAVTAGVLAGKRNS